MIQPPLTDYNGLTIVLSHESRFDQKNSYLLTGPARKFVDDILFPHGRSVDGCEIRLPIRAPFRAGTSHVVLCGEAAAHQYLGTLDHNASRGFVEVRAGARLVITFSPQDCCDIQDYESNEDEEEEDAADSGKDSSPTAWRNYRFWFTRDLEKLFGSLVESTEEASVRRVSQRDLQRLRGLRGQNLFLDIETHPETNTVAVVGFAVESEPTLTLPIYDYRGRLVATEEEIVTLARLLSRNKVIGHNVSGFDLQFLAYYHHLPFSRDIEDTMLMHHRLYPEAEKSLAHLISLYLNEPYHKDEGIFYPRNETQQNQLWLYNAKDVERTRAVWKALWKRAEGDSGLALSFNQVNAAIYPYIVTGMYGLGVSYTQEMGRLRRELSRRHAQYRRIIDILAGFEFNPASAKKCIEYFHGLMGYDPVKRSEITGQPSLGGDALYKLKVKTGNPIIDVILAARGCQKKLSMLNFKPLIFPSRR